MAVPKKHTTKSKRNKRRMHIFLKRPKLSLCEHCGRPKEPHRVCPHCGYYKKREVLDVLGKLEKKERKRREADIKEKEKKATEEKGLSLEELSKKKF